MPSLKSPNLLEFQPARTIKADDSEYDVYGCAKAQREGREYNGIALVHAVLQPFDAGESRLLVCRDGHVNRYSGLDIKTQTTEA